MARRLARIAALTTALVPSLSAGLGVGSIQTESALNEPLEARIPLESASAEEIESLRAALASPEAFDRAGLERPFLLSRLEFQVVSEGVREPFIAVRTSDPVREPFLALLVELNWSGGRLIREYTMLLDPPVYAPEESGPAVADGTPAAEQQRGRTEGARATPAQRGGRDGVTETDAPSEVRVQQDDTLWEVADRVRPDEGVTVHQMMMALLETNPEAFIDGNVNNVRAGAILRVPDRETARMRSAGEARQQFAAQVEAWRSGRTPEPDAADEPAVADEGSDATPEGRLEVVAAGDTAGGDATASIMDNDLEATPENVARLQSEITALREDEASLRSENDELRQQTRELLERVEALERTLNIRAEGAVPGTPQEQPADDAAAEPSVAAAPGADADGDAADDEGEASGDAAATADADGADDAGPTAGDSDAVAAGDEAGAADAGAGEELEGATADADTADADEAAAGDDTAAAAGDEGDAGAGEAAAADDPEAGGEEAADDGLQAQVADLWAQVPWQDQRVLATGGAGALAALLLLLMVVRRRRAAEEASAVVAAGAGAAQAEADEAASAAVSQAVAADATEAAGDSTAPSADVDPLEEIEVYLAYGRYGQASEMLARAVEAEPERTDLRLKQLEVHALSDDRPAFEADAQELYSRVNGSDDPVWERAREMGREIAPENPLFSVGAASGMDEPAEAPAPADPAPAQSAPEPVTAADADATEDDGDDFGDLEFSLDDDAGEAGDEPPARPAAAEAPPAAEEADDDAFSLDFDLDDFQAPAGGDDGGDAGATAGGDVEDDDELSLEFESWERPGGDEASAEAAGQSGPAEEAGDASEDGEDDAPAFDLDSLDLGDPVSDAAAEEEGLRYDGLPEDEAALEPEPAADEAIAPAGAGDASAADPDAASAADDDTGAPGDADGGDADEDLFDTGDENSTKLDLARAYMDMGDSEGARSLLDEVMQEGSEEQRTEAQSLYEEAH